MNLKLLTAAAVLSTAVVAPALAQDPHGRSDAIRQSQTQDRVYNRHSGFWPGEVAAGVLMSVAHRQRLRRPDEAARPLGVFNIHGFTSLSLPLHQESDQQKWVPVFASDREF